MKSWIVRLGVVASLAMPVLGVAADDVCADLRKNEDGFEAFQKALTKKLYTKGKARIPGVVSHAIGPCAPNWDARVYRSEAKLDEAVCGVRVIFDADDETALKNFAQLKQIVGSKGLTVEVGKTTLPLCASTPKDEVVAMLHEEVQPKAAMAFGLAPEGFRGGPRFTPYSPIYTVNAPGWPLTLNVPGFPRFVDEVFVDTRGNCDVGFVKVFATELIKPTKEKRGEQNVFVVNDGDGATISGMTVTVQGSCQLQVKVK